MPTQVQILFDFLHTNIPESHGWEVVDKIRKFGIESLESSLISELESSNANIRMYCTILLSGQGGTKAFEKISVLLQDPNEMVRLCAAGSIGNYKNELAVEPLIKLLNDPFAPVRINAANSLATIGDKRAVKPLIKLLKDKDADVRNAAIMMLGELGDSSALEYLEQIEQSDETRDQFEMPLKLTAQDAIKAIKTRNSLF